MSGWFEEAFAGVSNPRALCKEPVLSGLECLSESLSESQSEISA